MATSGAIRPSMGSAVRAAQLSGLLTAVARPPASPFLASTTQTAGLSTTTSLLKRHTYAGARDNRDHSKKRGESALRRTGTRWRLSMSDEPLPRPVPKEKLPPVETDPDHGLWDFFYDRETVVNTPQEDAKHGRGWSVEELRHKSWDDLHRLWWVCVKERNRISTANYERRKSRLGFGDAEAKGRDREVRVTMRGIKHVLTERFYAWEDAKKLAETDPEVDLSGEGVAYTPMEYLEEEEVLLEEQTEAAEAQLEGHETQQEGKASGPAAVDPSTLPSEQTSREAPRI
ncbi:mitochondrial 39-S ribosomal protein L47 (MRP-L47)-domain-containing protein [Diplogelasinospora grovesii]|uniref:Large ribosomal subunit protein uL29m n=1 Tax=Diplogelasinospora grovesii TaxID=303347 RepID=A0AAN6N7I8_9PEZI|nr:mitochondrial 39-S ribosomal protein L47 (MRP-L47)-domain-containing protein [Diplogelasinospora grovesii]